MKSLLMNAHDAHRGFQLASGRMAKFTIKARTKRAPKVSAQRLNRPVNRSAAAGQQKGTGAIGRQQVEALAGGIAHQFNNNLFVITANLELLEMKGHRDANSAQHIQALKGAAQRMTEMTRQLLDYARGRKYQPRPISLSDMVRARLPHIQRVLGASVPVEADLGAAVWKTNADPTQMQTVLEALLTNAAEALNDTGRIRIVCNNKMLPEKQTRRRPGLKPGAYVNMEIQDDGVGMDEKTLRRVFEPFFTTKFVGRGLGLAAAYGIVKNHDGWIGVESKLGKGTIVRIHLPAIQAADEQSVFGIGDRYPTCTCPSSSKHPVSCRCFG
ncbi:sensor histidine kinase [Desulfatitalea alkaliphila]